MFAARTRRDAIISRNITLVEVQDEGNEGNLSYKGERETYRSCQNVCLMKILPSFTCADL